MEKINLNYLGVSELSKNDLKNTNGGILPIIVGIVVLSISLGYSDGRRDKHAND
ncbi:class IIb bacteriocin, lactobin A/cerein 7B family [Seonamhaeicola sp. S2-3]|uniref:class IIb bacteriocin, lactobin A/cerein 7B family n=1 Tax=Seonamhaeicola sp. S2-3 TaxID=1936081 RepID=UPI0009F89C42|nr:class IIb bacteriocin, lactobin A/cerein 7B family [Seonamhaeicola sp. S2-3]